MNQPRVAADPPGGESSRSRHAACYYPDAEALPVETLRQTIERFTDELGSVYA